MTKQTEAMKLVLGKIKSARDCHLNAVDTLLFEAEEILEQALAEQPAQQEPVGMVKDLFTNSAWEKLDVLGSTKVYFAAAPQPAQQEPVGSVHVDTLAMLPSIKPIDGGAKIYPVSKAKYDAAYRLIYTSPPAQRTWVGLTRDEVETLSYKAEDNTWAAVELAEAKLKEKNT